MRESYIKIVGFGLIGEDTHGGPFRQVIFKEADGERTGELLVFKKERPSLWEDIEKLERGGNVPPYRGHITRFSSVDLVILGEEGIEEAFARQRWKLRISDKLTYEEAELKRIKSAGYITNLTNAKGMEINWNPVDKNTLLIKYRTYRGKGEFTWTNWYEIVSG
jgi:hypothetical protein